MNNYVNDLVFSIYHVSHALGMFFLFFFTSKLQGRHTSSLKVIPELYEIKQSEIGILSA